MKRIISAIVVMSSVTLLSSCTVDSVDQVNYAGYRPGYTGYTVSVADYPSNGYGPSFWSPGYYNSMGYRGVYGANRVGYYNNYRTAAYGYHGYNYNRWHHRR